MTILKRPGGVSKNPTFPITTSDPSYKLVKVLLKRAKDNGDTKLPVKATLNNQELGYRGLILPCLGLKKWVFGEPTIDLQLLLLQAVPNDELSEVNKKNVAEIIRKQGQVRVKRAAPEYIPFFWRGGHFEN